VWAGAVGTFLVATALAWRVRAVAGLLAAGLSAAGVIAATTCSAMASTALAFTVAFAAVSLGATGLAATVGRPLEREDHDPDGRRSERVHPEPRRGGALVSLGCR
jgi:hypothetical protein